MKLSMTLLPLLLVFAGNAQKQVRIVEKGNQEYRRKQYDAASKSYEQALSKDQQNTTALFNRGNAQQQLKKFEEAARLYEAAAAATKDETVKAGAYYNQGLSFVRQNKLPEAIEAFKKSLRLNPNDSDARENLQKALKTVQQQQSQQDDQQQDKNKKKPKDQKQSKPSGARLSKEEAEKMLNNLGKEEKNLQKEVQKKNQSARQIKDW